MGKKDKSKKKISGSVKTAMKTEKKLIAKQKKELAARGEDDIEKVVAQIEAEEARRQHVVEATVEAPSRRVNFSLTAHPFKDELIMLGGEFHDGRKTVVYGDMFFFNITKKGWSIVKAPRAPPPRCGHQAIATSTSKGELWVFGGEFSSPSGSQFYHYRDLWVYYIGEKTWQKITAPGGPSPRSGHRMAYVKKQLIIFGGFHDNLRDYKYFNDVHIFDIANYRWNKIDIFGNIPAPRSGCILLPTTQNSVLLYGGYSKERIKKDVDKGHVHTDMFLLAPEKNDETGLKWQWNLVKQTGIAISPRCSASAILVQPGLAYMFGGVYDDVENDEELDGTFFNELLGLDMEKYQWRIISVSGKKELWPTKRRRRKPKNEEDEGETSESEEDDQIERGPTSSVERSNTTDSAIVTDDDGIFTMTVGPAPVQSSGTFASRVQTDDVFTPCPRINTALAMKNGVLYMYGGMFEDGDKQCTLNDFYCLDARKLDEWRTIMKDDLSAQVWLDSESSDSANDDDNDDDDDENNEDKSDIESNSDEDMEVERK